MAPSVLEGHTLGNRQRYYNELIKETIERNKMSELDKINTEESDIDNMLKIDIASRNRNLEYILEVLKNEDMLYVSRAIKQCTWLITDKQYSHIINPKYLHSDLFPHMTSKACNKLMLHIRLNLKDKTRVEEFYNFLKENDLKIALKWLPECSVAVIEEAVESHHNDIKEPLLKRICEKSITVLEIYIRKIDYYKSSALQATMFLLNTDVEKYMAIVDTLDPYQIPRFGAKATETLIKKYPEKILDNFEKYADKIDIRIFAKSFKKEDIQAFLVKHSKNEKLQSWFDYDNLKHFISYMPKEGRFDFLKRVLIEKSNKGDCKEQCDELHYRCASSAPTSSSANVYRWYRFAPFDVAFRDLQKLLRAESSPGERNSILAVLLSSAGRNLQHIQTLLQFYHDKHINEPFKFKIQFVNIVLSKTATHKYDEKTWNILNTLFCSMEVYMESNNNVQSCIQSIILYKVLHNEKVPENIEKKFTFDTMKALQQKLNEEEKNKIVNYLYTYLATKIQCINVTRETDAEEVVKLLKNVLNLFIDWKKQLSDFPWVLIQIKELIKKNKNNSWKTDLSSLYNKNKTWRKLMFEESIVMSPSEEVCLNALKHGPQLLTRHKCEVEALCRNDAVSLRRLLGKLRVYWPQSLAGEWAASYLGRLEQTGGYKALTRGICVLLPGKQLIDIIKKYVPTETKINWSEDNELLINLRKHFAKNMHFARPQPSPDVVLLFAQGDYLQHALSSLNAILHNMSPERSRSHIPKFLDAPVSLQKHGIRLAFTKLESQELKKIFTDIWNSTKNSSIRAVLFKQTYDLLCREKTPSMIEEIWELLAMFIDNLSTEENKAIYVLLGKVDKVPLAIRPKFLMKSYRYLKSLPVQANCESIVENFISNHTRDLVEDLDPDFVENILKESLDKKFTTERYRYTDIMSSYLLCTKNEESQMQRYEGLVVPLLERSFALWKVKVEGCYCVKYNVKELLKQLWTDLQEYVFNRKMIFPVKMFTGILDKLEGRLSISENYVVLRSWKLTVTYLKVLETHKELLATIKTEKNEPSFTDYGCYEPERDGRWNEIYTEARTDFTKSCLQFLKEDVELYFPSIYYLFAKAFENVFNSINNIVYFETMKSCLGDEGFVLSYLLVLKCLPRHFMTDDEREKSYEVRKMIYLHPSPEVRMHYCNKYKTPDLDFEDY